ncbi:hypothetical protein JL721_10540 [Aureococcus anophagefferens]|nr:hypothetical protein JL721_10540 [Aureococcus anophagefferens]
MNGASQWDDDRATSSSPTAATSHLIMGVCLKLVLTRVAPGAIVVREGEVGNDLYFIANGSIALLITLPPGVAADLDVEPRAGFATLRRGDSFAHYSIAATKTAKHPYSARSLDSSELLVLSAPNFRALRDEFPNFGVAMGRLVALALAFGGSRRPRHLTAVRHAVVRYGLADDGEPRSCYRSCGRSLRGGRPRDRGSLAGGAAGGAYDAFGPSEHDASVLDDFEEQRSVRAHRHDPPAPRSKLPDGLTARVALAACLWLKTRSSARLPRTATSRASTRSRRASSTASTSSNATKAGLMKTLRKFSLEEKNRDFAKGVAKPAVV